MGELISEDNPRIKFSAKWEGPWDRDVEGNEEVQEKLIELGELQTYLEEVGVIPILNDGLVGGNCSMMVEMQGERKLFVSRSGKEPKSVLRPQDFVQIAEFDQKQWSVAYKSKYKEITPTSDTPLHVAALLQCHPPAWTQQPMVVIHGHALAEGAGLDAAKQQGFPISNEVTLFSTRQDLAALEDLFTKYPYPQNQCYVRKGHGFLLLAKDTRHAAHYFNTILEPLIVGSRNE